MHYSISLVVTLLLNVSYAYSNIHHSARYAKLGLMGVTVIYSSGDDGVAGQSRPQHLFILFTNLVYSSLTGHAGLCLMPDGENL